MKIYIVGATGAGNTELSAFDNALHNAGVANYNLIHLSSIIPPGTEIIETEKLNWNGKEFGHRLYCVIAKQTITTFDEQAWAGIGWVQAPDGRGLFVEHYSENENVVRKLIDSSLSDMMDYRTENYGPIKTKVSGIECINKPVCALAIAVYQTKGW